MHLRLAGLVLTCALAASCVTIPDAPEAVTVYGRQDCGAQPDLAQAAILRPERGRSASAYTVTTPVTAQTPCVTTAEGASPYVAFALPAELSDKTITVGAPLEVLRIFAPRVVVLDAQGVVTRTFEREHYLYRGPVYSMQFRPRAGDAFILVTAEPALVGQRYDSISIATYTTATYVGTGAVSWTSGVDSTHSRAFSYEGAVQVTVHDSNVGR